MLNFDDYAGLCGLGGLCWVLMILNMMLDFDDFEDDTEYG